MQLKVLWPQKDRIGMYIKLDQIEMDKTDPM